MDHRVDLWLLSYGLYLEEAQQYVCQLKLIYAVIMLR